MTKIHPIFSFAALINIILLLTACAQNDPRETARVFTKKSGLTSTQFATSWINLQGWQRIASPVSLVRIYIEGDGFAWVSRTQPSADPTPRNPVGLQLAAADKSANVIYLARPCQFIGPPLPAVCTTHLWTDKRFSSEVVQAMDEAISQAVQPYPQAKIELVGYSGGATIAAQLAARRHDVVSLRTVAGNLDVAYVNALHHVSAMPDALSAIDVAADLKNLPQLHISGGDDSTVPPAVATRFQRATGTQCAKVVSVPDMRHGSDWAAVWPGLLARPLNCEP
nr:alpha/beta hydrolase [Enterobacter sp.]